MCVAFIVFVICYPFCGRNSLFRFKSPCEIGVVGISTRLGNGLKGEFGMLRHLPFCFLDAQVWQPLSEIGGIGVAAEVGVEG